MTKKDEKLISLIQRAQSGQNGNTDKISEMIYDEVWALVRPLYDTDDKCKKTVKKIINDICDNVDNIDADDGVHEWIAQYTTFSLYEMCSKKYGNLFSDVSVKKTYPCNSIKSDTGLQRAAVRYNKFLKTNTKYSVIEEAFGNFTVGQVILYELFCYEGLSIDEIKYLLDVDSKTIRNELSLIRKVIIPDNILETSEPLGEDNEYSQDEDNIGIDDSDDGEDGIEILDIEDDESDDEEDDENDEVDILEFDDKNSLKDDSKKEKHHSKADMRLRALCIIVPCVAVLLFMLIMVFHGIEGNKPEQEEQTEETVSEETVSEETVTKKTTKAIEETQPQQETQQNNNQETIATEKTTTKKATSANKNTNTKHNNTSSNKSTAESTVAPTEPVTTTAAPTEPVTTTAASKETEPTPTEPAQEKPEPEVPADGGSGENSGNEGADAVSE